MNLYDITWCEDEHQQQLCFKLREEVFIKEQGFAEEFDETDSVAHHLLITDQKNPIATARLFSKDGEWIVGRICVSKEYRKKGIGAVIMQHAEQKAKQLGARNLILSAQAQASAFYEKCGYEKQGQEYMDEHCLHIKMMKEL
ncbi:MAG: family N-acetyltransferase [Oscillospiraceae bacterium]|jgi:predicted GNAT family N-acyltransferase|nr:family N-acetyltransferase [Oscillospiraceae bacterium]